MASTLWKHLVKIKSPREKTTFCASPCKCETCLKEHQKTMCEDIENSTDDIGMEKGNNLSLSYKIKHRKNGRKMP